MTPFLSIQNLGVHKAGQQILSDISLDIDPGDLIVLQGPSGSGKTTFLRSLLLFEVFSKGNLFWKNTLVDHHNFREYRDQLAFAAQKPPAFEGTVEEFIRLPTTFGRNRHVRIRAESIEEAFGRFNLPLKTLSQSYGSLSGGEQQRIALVQIIVLDRPVWLLDEITSNLDETNASRVIEALTQYRNKTLIAVTHDSRWNRLNPRFVNLQNGRIVSA